MNTLTDLHIHTLVSDGTNHPDELLKAAAQLGLKHISFTDHDAIGAYRNFVEDVFRSAASLGLTLIPGIELDSEHQGHEIHVLGYGLDLRNGPLNHHLEKTQRERKEKTRQQIAAINTHFGRTVIVADHVFITSRDTLMKPHLIHTMLNQHLFTDYRDAAKWLKDNIQVTAEIHKPSVHEAIALLVQAGAKPVLAHPGFLVKEAPFSLELLIEELIPLGLAGLETEYPYWTPEQQHNGVFPDCGSGEEMMVTIHRLARKFNLETTRGSDAHDIHRLESFAQRKFDQI